MLQTSSHFTGKYIRYRTVRVPILVGRAAL